MILRAAIYARKSTDSETGIAYQVDAARDFAASKGWVVDPAHVYSDNDVSGGVFKRPGLDALMFAVTSSARPFDCLVMMSADRLGRDMVETLPLQRKITRAGVSIWHYQNGQQLILNTPTDELRASIDNFGAADFRYQIGLKTTNRLLEKARRGYAVGGRMYGFAHICSQCGAERCPCLRKNGDRKRVVIEAEAQVIRRMFMLAQEGKGPREIARRLNSEGTPPPPKRKDKPGKEARGGEWTRTTIASMLDNEAYQGRFVYAKSRALKQGDGQRQVNNPPAEWVTYEDESLRIVSAALWDGAHAQLAQGGRKWAKHRTDQGKLTGRPEGISTAAHLLGGLLRCECGSIMIPTARRTPAGTVRRYYCCRRRYVSGSVRCRSRHMLNYEAITRAVVGHFDQHHDSIIEDLVSKEQDTWIAEQRAAMASVEVRRAEVAQLDLELGRLSEAIAKGGDLQALVTALKAKQQARDAAAALLEHAEGMTQVDLAEMRRRTLQATFLCLGSLRDTLQTRGPEGREMLKAVIQEPIRVRQVYVGETFVGWDYEGEADLVGITTVRGRIPGKKASSERVPIGRSQTGRRRSRAAGCT